MVINVKGQDITFTEPVTAKHKFTLTDLGKGDSIFLYGIKVGETVEPVRKGAASSTRNTVNATGTVIRNIARNFKWSPPPVDVFKDRTFMGYHRADRRVGTANYWIVVPMVFCENKNLEIIKEAIIPELGFTTGSKYSQYIREIVDKGSSRNENSDTKTIVKRLFKNETGIQFLVHD